MKRSKKLKKAVLEIFSLYLKEFEIEGFDRVELRIVSKHQYPEPLEKTARMIIVNFLRRENLISKDETVIILSH